MRVLVLALGLFALALMPVRSGEAQPAGAAAVYSIAYFEAGATAVTQTAALARQFAAASRKEPGNTGFQAFEEIGRPSRLATFEAWRDKAAFEAHLASASAVAFHDKVQPGLVGPFEIRLFGGLSVARPSATGGSQAVYVLTHVDVFPAGKDQAAGLVKSLAEAARKMDGNLWFDVLQWDGHPNHFALVQGWRDRKAFDASLMSAATSDFRKKLTPLEGALYDERLYRALR